MATSTGPISDLIVETATDFKVSTRIYSDGAIFEEELERIFERTWVYVAHESEVQEPGDYLTTYIGRQPVIVSRGADGQIHVMVNACRHRGNTVCREERGNTATFRCAYHGWVYKCSGELLNITERGRYPEGFGEDLTGLVQVPRVTNYRGLVFASFNPQGESVEEYLGGVKKYVDLWIERSPTGRIRVLPPHKFLVSGNWKYQVDNSVEGYHAWHVHKSAFMTMRHSLASQADYGGEREEGRIIGFEHGHGVMERPGMTSMDKAIFAEYFDCLVKSYGDERAREIVYGRNIVVFPNLALLENNIRVVSPRAVDSTEMYSYFFDFEGVPDPVNSDNLRDSQWRRGTMSFVNSDDLEMFSSNQGGARATRLHWTTIAKGMHDETVLPEGGRAGKHIHDETGVRAVYREWARLMSGNGQEQEELRR